MKHRIVLLAVVALSSAAPVGAQQFTSDTTQTTQPPAPLQQLMQRRAQMGAQSGGAGTMPSWGQSSLTAPAAGQMGGSMQGSLNGLSGSLQDLQQVRSRMGSMTGGQPSLMQGLPSSPGFGSNSEADDIKAREAMYAKQGAAAGGPAPAATPLFKPGELDKVINNAAHQYRMQTPGFVDHPRDLPKPGEVSSLRDAIQRRMQEQAGGGN